MDIDECRRSSTASDVSMPGMGFSWRSIVGILCILTSSVLFTGLNVTSKVIYNSTTISAFEMSYLRCFVTIVANGLYASYLRLDMLAVSKHVAETLFYRVIFATCGFIFGFWGLRLMTFSEYTSVSYVYPMLTQVAAYILIREKLTIYDAVSCVMSFVGVIIIASHYTSNDPTKGATSIWVFSAPLIAAAFWALGDVYQRKIKSQIHYVICPMYLCVGGCIACALLAFLNNSQNNTYTHYDWKIVALVITAGLFGTVGTIFSTLAFQYEKAGRLVIFNYLSVPYALLIDYFYFEIDLSYYDVLGAFLIISGSGTITFLKGFGFIG